MVCARESDLISSFAHFERFDIEFVHLIGLEVHFDEACEFIQTFAQVLQAIARHLDSGRIFPDACIKLADSILISIAALEKSTGRFVLAVLLKDIDAQDQGTGGHLRGLKLQEFTVNQGGPQDLKSHLEDDIMLIVIQDAHEALQ